MNNVVHCCYGCTRRHENCHSSCPDHAARKQRDAELAEAIRIKKIGGRTYAGENNNLKIARRRIRDGRNKR